MDEQIADEADVNGLMLQLGDLMQDLEEFESHSILEHYDPYPYQVKFHSDEKRFRCLRAGNRIGKTHSGGAELAYHLTGLYPDWWKGRRYDHAIRAVAAGKNNDKTRDIVQADLLGDPANNDAQGTGWIPKDCIIDTVRKQGVPDAKYHVLVKHVTGGTSKLTFLVYDMGKETWMAHKSDYVWLDEEPPEDIMSQAIRSIIDSGGSIAMTFTPENGTTGVVKTVQDQWSMHQAGWKDVSGSDFELIRGNVNINFKTMHTMSGAPGHLTQDKIESALTAMMPHEIRMRAEGIPLLGSGLVFPYPQEEIEIAPFEIPSHWPRIAGIDFGYTHATAVVWLALDTETNTVVIYDCIKIEKREIVEIAPYILQRDISDVPIAWPHDGNKQFGMGDSIQQQYRNYGVNLLPEKFTNPPKEGVAEHKGGIQIMPGIVDMATRMNEGRLKVFSHLVEWFDEYKNYHHKDHKIVDRDDDLMAATRYAVMSIRFADRPDQRYFKPKVKKAIH